VAAVAGKVAGAQPDGAGTRQIGEWLAEAAG
jgi:hypothetical protein